MRFRNMLCLIAAAILLGTAFTAQADVPQLMNYQGILLSGGTPITTPIAVVFAIWDDPTTGDSLWSEQQVVSPDGDGRFNVLLGSGSAIPDSAFAGDAYLSVKVDTDPEMTPRQRIVAVGYAYRVSTVDGAAGGAISSKVAIGPGNTNAGTEAFVAGQNNTADGNYTTIGGGANNGVSGNYSTIAGGQNNSTGGYYNSIAGGGNNRTAGLYSSIAGGQHNRIMGDYSFTTGFADTVSSKYSCLFGINSDLGQDSTFMVDMPHIRFGDATTGYEFPTDDGAADQVMATDGSGKLNWTEVSSGDPDGDWTIAGDNQYSTVSGNVGIGTTTPDGKLSVEATTGDDFGVYSTIDHTMGMAVYGENGATGTSGSLGHPDCGVLGFSITGNAGSLGGDSVGVEGSAYREENAVMGVMGTASGAAASTFGVFGKTGGEGTGFNCGVYGENNLVGNSGWLGGDRAGAMGLNAISGNYGMLGGDSVGVTGYSYREENLALGVLGTVEGAALSTIGVFGETAGEGTSFNCGVYGENDLAGNYGLLGSGDAGAMGSNSHGSFGILGADSVGVYGHGISSDDNVIGVMGTAEMATGSIFGVYGETSGEGGGLNCGVYGLNRLTGNEGWLGGNGSGVLGYHGTGDISGSLGNEHYGVEGNNYTSGNFGALAGDSVGVFGHAIRDADNAMGIMGTVEGTAANTFGVFGQTSGEATGLNCGVYGQNDLNGNSGWLGSSHEGVYGVNATTGNEGYLGGDSVGVYGGTPNADDYAGLFAGKVLITDDLGIGTDQPDEELHVVGNIKMVDGNEAAGFVMISDANGVGSWQAASGGGSRWASVDSVLYTDNYLGIARGGAENVLIGDYKNSHVNLGVACTTGVVGQNWYYATVSGGADNKARRSYSTIAGGKSNEASNWSAAIAGGEKNTASGDRSFIGGGYSNEASGQYAALAGGMANTASGMESFVGSGYNNEASAQGAVVGGGWENAANGEWSFVGCGGNNKARGAYSVVAGGGDYDPADSNSAIGDYSAIGGGARNTAGGSYSTVPGGYDCLAAGVYSFAAGRHAQANHQGAFVWGDSYDGTVASSANNQFKVRASGGTIFYSNSGLSTGVTLAAGGGAWASVSDRNLKDNFVPVDAEDVLDKVASLPLSTWNYKSQDEAIRHMGPMAQDFYALFGLGDDNVTISTIDPAGVALAAIQALNAKNLALEQQVAELQKLVKKLLAEQE